VFVDLYIFEVLPRSAQGSHSHALTEPRMQPVRFLP